VAAAMSAGCDCAGDCAALAVALVAAQSAVYKKTHEKTQRRGGAGRGGMAAIVGTRGAVARSELPADSRVVWAIVGVCWLL